MPAAEAEAKKITDLPGFTVEFGNIYNSGRFIIQTLREQFRGAWKVSNYSKRPQGARELSPKFYQMPDIPGIQLEVSFKEYCVRAHDPLTDDPEKMSRINGLMKSGPVSDMYSNYGPHPDKKIMLDPDQLQTLVKELRGMEKAENLVVIKGKIPSFDEMETREGRILHDPASNNPLKPKYEEDKHEWVKDMLRLNQ